MKKIFLYLMSLLYIAAGINHFIHPTFYLKIIPNGLPQHEALNYISGMCEIIFGILLIPLFTRRIAAWLIIILLVAIYPANIQMFLDYLQRGDPNLWITIIRLPIQIVLIWWAWKYTKHFKLKS